MVSSHTAPARIAPRPVWKKYWPESSEERHGVQEGAGCRSDAAEDQPGMAGLRGGALWWGGGQGAGGAAHTTRALRKSAPSAARRSKLGVVKRGVAFREWLAPLLASWGA